MNDGSEKRNRHLAFELQNSHVCEKRSKTMQNYNNLKIIFGANMRRTIGHKKG